MMTNIDMINFMIEVLEAYKGGEKIEYRIPKHREKVENRAYIDEWTVFPEGAIPDFFKFEYRIKPKSQKYRLAVFGDKPFVLSINDDKNMKMIENDESFIRWLTDWVEYEI